MSYSCKQIGAQLRQHGNLVRASSSDPGLYKFTLHDKSYLIRKISDDKYSVVRNYEPTQCCDWIKTKLAHFFGMSNRKRIERVLLDNPSLFRTQQHQPAEPISIPSTVSVATPLLSGEQRPFYALSMATKQHLDVIAPDFESKRAAATNNLTASGRFYVVESRTGNKVFCDTQEKLPPIWRPVNRVTATDERSGSEKKVVAEDGRYVELKSHKPRKFASCKEKFDKIAEALSPFKTCCASRLLDGDTVIALKGGNQDLYEYSKRHRVPIKAFKPALVDLQRMHEQDIYLRDIKSENLTIRDGIVLFIDTDEAAIPALNNYDESKDRKGESPKYTPTLLTSEILSGRKAGHKGILRIGDDYAMLLTIIETNSNDKKLQSITQAPAGNSHFMPNTTLFNSGNTRKLQQWVQINIKDGYQQQVIGFLQNPVGKPLQVPLLEVFN